MSAELIVLRLVHVVGGAFWVGAMLMNGLFLLPSLSEAGPAGAPVMAGLMRRKLMSILPLVAILTILAGMRLMWIASAASGGVYFQSSSGRTFAIGGAAAIVSFLIGILVSRPSAMRAGQLGAALSKAPEPERAALAAELSTVSRRAVIASKLVVVLLLIATGAMAIARYLG